VESLKKEEPPTTKDILAQVTYYRKSRPNDVVSITEYVMDFHDLTTRVFHTFNMYPGLDDTIVVEILLRFVSKNQKSKARMLYDSMKTNISANEVKAKVHLFERIQTLKEKLSYEKLN